MRIILEFASILAESFRKSETASLPDMGKTDKTSPYDIWFAVSAPLRLSCIFGFSRLLRVHKSFLVYCLIFLFSAPFLAAPASADYKVEYWNYYSQRNEDPVALCKSINVSTATTLYYNGAYFDAGLSGPSPTSSIGYDCRDIFFPQSSLHGVILTLRCVTFSDLGVQIGGAISGACPAVPDGASCKRVGNPTDVSNLAKYEHAVDWVSPKDSRFAIERFYTSSGSSYKDIVYPTNAPGLMSLGGVWRSGFDDVASFVRPDATYNPPSGRVIALPTINSTTGTKNGFPYTVSRLGGSTRTSYIADGTGKKMKFSAYPGKTVQALVQIVWPDGYVIDIVRNPTDFSVYYIKDNRGQRANYTTSLSAVPNNSVNALTTKIEVDTEYDGTTFAPEVELNYNYAPNDLSSGWPMITSVVRRDVPKNASQTIASYGYSDTSKFFPPLLTSIYDGRLDTGGNPIEYASFSYRAYDMTLPAGLASTPPGSVLSSSHAGGSLAAAFGISTPSPIHRETVHTNALGLGTTYTYDKVDSATQLTKIEGAAASNTLATVKSLDYTPNSGAPLGFVYARTERNGSKTTFNRDVRGLVLTQTEDALGVVPRVTSYTWHATLRLPLTRITDGLSEAFAYTAEGLLTSYSQTDTRAGSPTQGQVRTWTYAYTTLASGLKVMTSLNGPGLVADGINDVTSYSYTANGELATTTDANGLVTTVLTRNDQGQPTSVEGPDKNLWSFTYDRMGRVLTSGFAAPGQAALTNSYTYDVVGQLLSMTNTRGKTWTFTYDAARRLVQTTSPSGDKANFTSDTAGNVTRTEYQNGAGPVTFWEEARFDELSRLLKTIGAQGQQWQYVHDVEGNLSSEIDPLNYATTNGFDALNRLVSTVDRDGFTKGMEHNPADQLEEYTDPRSIKTDFAYNGFGEVVTETSADRGTIVYSYDRRGLVTSRTDGRGVTINYIYDNGGRITVMDYPSGGIPDQAFTYDTPYLGVPPNANKGKVGQISDGVIQTQFGHELQAAGPKVTAMAIYPLGRSYTVVAASDFEGNPTSLTYPSGREVHYDIDDDNRVSRIRLKDGAIWTTLLDQMIYRPGGPLAAQRYGDGFTQSRNHDASYRLTGMHDTDGTTTLRQTSYGYEGRDNLISVTDALTPLNSETFGYTAREHLASASGAYGQIAFAYDGVGNRTSRSINPGTGALTDVYSYPFTSNRLSGISLATGGTRGFTYDAAGNVTYDNHTGGNYGYTYDAAGRMSEFSIAGVVQATYKYDFEGRQAIRYLPQAGVTIYSVFDSSGNRIAEYDQTTGALIREYVWNGLEPVAVIEGGVIYYIRTDHIGRPVFATNASGAKVWTASYLPFGGVHTTIGTPINLRFPGQWFQSESGLHQNWMRDYDPTTGRYIQADPLGLVAGMSVYGYANQSPMMYIDPNGENPVLVAMLVGGLASLALDYLGEVGAAYYLDRDICYSLGDGAKAFALGAAFSGGGLWATGVKRAGKEFSHFVPTRFLKNGRFGTWLNKSKNSYRSLNGNYVSAHTHAMTDYYRRLKGMKADDMYLGPTRALMRTPAWMFGSFAGLMRPSTCECGQ